MDRKQTRRQRDFRRRDRTGPASPPATHNAAVAAALPAAVRHLHAGQLQRSEALCREVLEARPDHHAALHLLGVVMHRMGRKEAAVELIGKAVAVRPDYAEAHNGLGNVLAEMGRLGEAAAAYRMTVAIKPGYAEAHCNLGTTLSELGELDEAAAALEKAIALKPDLAQAHNNLGIVLQQQEKFADAAASCRRAIAINPKLAEAHNNLGSALKELGRFDEAIAAHQHALDLKPEFAEAHTNLGNALKDQGRLAEAIAAHRKAIALKPAYAEAHFNLGMALLLFGQYEDGWNEYEWRLKTKSFASRRRDFPGPLWDGSDLEGKTILLHTEQGFGDAIQFARYVPIVAARGGRVLLECRRTRTLRNLLAGIDGVAALLCDGQELPSFDFHCPVLSLPRVLGTSLETIPANVPYLKPDAGKLGAWRARLGGEKKGLKVGLVWAGRPTHKNDHNRSIELGALAPLLMIEGVDFFSLQKGPRATDIEAFGLSERIVDLDPHLTDFTDTAAAVSALDLVISVDTAAAHLAGALGRPVWTLLPFVADWRWMVARGDSPWYPSMRLFRQAKWGEWEPVIEQVREELAKALACPDGARLSQQIGEVGDRA